MHIQGREGANIFAAYEKIHDFIKKFLCGRRIEDQKYDCFESLLDIKVIH